MYLYIINLTICNPGYVKGYPIHGQTFCHPKLGLFYEPIYVQSTWWQFIWPFTHQGYIKGC